MDNLEIIEDIFNRTRSITKLIIPNQENLQIVSIMNYFLVTSLYLNGRREVSKFKKNWTEISNQLKQGIDKNIWREYYNSIHNNVNSRLTHEEVSYNELANFYQNIFLRMYGEAKMKYDSYYKNFGDRRREHYEYIFSTNARFEEALSNGDPAAFCD